MICYKLKIAVFDDSTKISVSDIGRSEYTFDEQTIYIMTDEPKKIFDRYDVEQILSMEKIGTGCIL